MMFADHGCGSFFQRLAAASLVAVLSHGPAGAQVEGSWHGKIDVQVMKLEIQVDLNNKQGAWTGTIDIPAQGANGFPLENVRVDGDAVHFELVGGAGRATFEGTLGNGRIAGSFRQGPAQGTFDLERGPLQRERWKPKEPPTYDTAEVTIAAGDRKLAATLTIPRGEGPFPGVALVTGSGPQTRDEEVAGFPVFAVLADGLARQGIAVLRYDDRGTGKSTGDFKTATTDDFADDAEAAAAWLAARDEVASDRVGIVGHSEGGLVAPIIAARNDKIGFVVLLAGPAVSGADILREQARLIAKAGGATDEDIEQTAALQEALFQAIRGEADWKPVEERLRTQLEEKLPEDQLDAIVAANLRQYQTPWFRHFVVYDPAPALAGLQCPVLALFGEKDLQVPPAQSRPVMKRVFEESGNARAQIAVGPGANHLFQAAKTGAPSEYSALPKAFTAGFVDRIATWIHGLGNKR